MFLGNSIVEFKCFRDETIVSDSAMAVGFEIDQPLLVIIVEGGVKYLLG